MPDYGGTNATLRMPFIVVCDIVRHNLGFSNTGCKT